MIGSETIEHVVTAVDSVISAIDRTMSQGVEGWMNGDHRPEREAERMSERMIIDPPLAAIAWRVSGTSRALGRGVEVMGCSQFQFDDDGRIASYWIYVDQSWLRG